MTTQHDPDYQAIVLDEIETAADNVAALTRDLDEATRQRDRFILEARLHGVSLGRIGKVLGLTPGAVGGIARRAQAKYDAARGLR